MQCMCSKLVFLSQEHLILLFGWSCVVALMVVEVVTNHAKGFDLWLYLAALPYFICLMILIVAFEHIDIVQRLEREVQQLKEESERVRNRREQMVTFWNGMQQLTDLWVHRTVPRLDLLKEVQQYLEFAPPQNCLSYMANANSRLEELERALPALEVWKNVAASDADGDVSSRLSEASKKSFSARITGLCREDSLEKLVIALHRVVQDDMPRLTDDVRAPQVGGSWTQQQVGGGLNKPQVKNLR